MGLTFAGLGERDAAVEAGLRALELWPLEQDTLVGAFFVDLLAAIYSKVGDVEAAIDLIENLMDRPSFLTVPRLRMEPDWDPLRAHPRFHALVG